MKLNTIMIFLAILCSSCSKKIEWNSESSEIKKQFKEFTKINECIWVKIGLNTDSSIPSPNATRFFGFIRLENAPNLKLGKEIEINITISIPDSWEYVNNEKFYALGSLSKKYSTVDGNSIIGFSSTSKTVYFEINTNFSSVRRNRNIPKNYEKNVHGTDESQ